MTTLRSRSADDERPAVGRWVLGIWMLAALLAPVARAANCNAIKVWSFNVRFDDGWSSCFSDCENQWFKGGAATARRDVARAFLTTYSPDIFGLQEVKNPAPFATTRASQLRDISSWFPKHGYYALDRGDGEHCAIFFRIDRFTPFDTGTFWMSCTPDVPSKHPRETGNFRITSWVRLIDNYTGTDFYVFNSHWSLDSAARDYSAALIRERISRIAAGAPVILLGDFNCAESDSPFDILLGRTTYPPSSDCSVQPRAVPIPSLPLVNSYREAIPTVSEFEKTAHGFSGESRGDPIDHILHTGGDFAPSRAVIRRDTYPGGCGEEGCYPSDHYAIEVEFRLLLQSAEVRFGPSSADCEAGTPLYPFRSITDALDVLKENGTLTLQNTSSGVGITINPGRGPITITSAKGPSILGKR